MLWRNGCAFLLVAVVSMAQAANPVIPDRAADPHAALFKGQCYLYATGAGATEPGFTVWSSPDLSSWKNEGMVLKFGDLKWTGADKVNKNAWAPAAIERDGKYYFYFSADSRIGVAVSDSPTGPFQDPLGKPLVPYRDDLSSIDPMAFIDDDGQAYLYWGAVPGSWLKGKAEKIYSHLFVRKLSKDMISFDGPEVATVETDPEKGPHIEGSFVMKRKGTYYLMWSTGSWDAAGGEQAYRVEYATASTPLGPFVRATNNPVLESDYSQKIIGPGHHSVIQIQGTDDYYIVYHMHKGDKDRHVFIDRMFFESNGSIRKIIPTLTGIDSIKLPQGF